MKKVIQLFFIAVSSAVFSQVTIGKNGASPSSNSVLLEFGNDGNKGIVMPYLEGEPVDSVPGTVIFDATEKKVKIKTSVGWLDLSGNTGFVDTSIQDALPFNTAARVVIGDIPVAGDSTTDVPGVLVLNSTTKAFVMPKVNSYTDIVDPAPGMIVYTTSNKQIAVFNGSTWSFWKE